MNVADIIVIGILFIILGIIAYVTRPKKGRDKCGSCKSDCSSCHGFSNFYEEYKKDQENKK